MYNEGSTSIFTENRRHIQQSPLPQGAYSLYRFMINNHILVQNYIQNAIQVIEVNRLHIEQVRRKVGFPELYIEYTEGNRELYSNGNVG